MPVYKQVLRCPVCGKSGDLSVYNIDPHGHPTLERERHPLGIKLNHIDPGQYRLRWTEHPVPLQVLCALKQQLVEALLQVEEAIQEVTDE